MSPYKKIADDFHNRFVQETKNYKDQNYALNQKIEDIDRAVAGLVRAQEEKISKVQSDQKRLEIALENLEAFVKGEVADCFTILDGYKEAINKQNRFMSAALCDLNSQYVRYSAFEETQGYNVKRLDKLEQEAEILEFQLRSQYDILRRQNMDSIAAAEEKIVEQFPSNEPLQRVMEERLKEIAVNFAGLVREIELCKGRISYGEKKFENIYTLIERLKGKL